MDLNRRVYRLSPSQFSAETIAVTFAKTSRSPEPFDVIAAELNDEKSAQFSEKWIVGYGHSSVAEHAVLHLALENVSRLAIETIESNRLASYTEKSTRYQEWDPKAYVTPPEIVGSPFEGGIPGFDGQTLWHLRRSPAGFAPLGRSQHPAPGE